MKKYYFLLVMVLTMVSCGKSAKQQERERNLQMLDNFIDMQVESGMGQRYQNLDEATKAINGQEQRRQQQGQYRQVVCPSCGGNRKYYNNSDGKWYTCPTCAGSGVVQQYN